MAQAFRQVCFLGAGSRVNLTSQFDPEGFGEIPWSDFLRALETPEFCQAVGPAKREILTAKAHRSHTSAITFDDFVAVMSGKRTRSFKIAVHRRDERDIWQQTRAGAGNYCQRHGSVSAATTPGRGYYGCGSSSSAADDEEDPWRRPGDVSRGADGSVFRTMVRAIATEFLPDGRDRKYYADHYSCRPPPLFVFVVTLIELGFFTYYTVITGAVTPTGPVPIDSFFIYRPDKRLQVWRFVFYMVLHAGWIHLLFNLLVQMLVGLPLEMVHGSLRIGTVYMAGVLAGSLGTSVFDTDVYLVGASGGVYALLAAHLANVLLNYNQMQFGLVRLVGVFLIASADVGFAVYDRYAAEPHGPPVSYVAHLTGALAGLTIGLLVLKNFEQKLHEHLLWWVALGVYAACTLFAVLFNIFNY